MPVFVDRVNRFFESFNPNTGMYFRSGVINEAGKDTGVDPFMRCFPSLIDIGIMNRCVCAERCRVDCYQKAIARTGSNMSVDDYMSIMRQCKGKVFQVALGGAGDPDTHESFETIMKITRDHGIVPNFTTSGIAFNKRKADICAEYAGAVAVSEHDADYTQKAIDLLHDAGVKVNVHYVLSNESIDVAITRLKGNYYSGINAVVFLLYKPIGLGTMDKVLKPNDPRLVEFFKVVEDHHFAHKVGFDSCTASAIVNYCNKIDMNSLDYCEGARMSCYIDADMNMMPCSFGNQDSKWFVSLRNCTIEEAWNSVVFNQFRRSLKESCPDCDKRLFCGGGCPICRDVVLCNRMEKKLV